MSAAVGISVADVTITPQLWVRAPRTSNFEAETAAMRRLADTMATDPSKTFQVCVDLALELCDADTCGISLGERTDAGEDIFRWIALAGKLKHHLHGTTPRYFSPCGMTVDSSAPILMKRPELVYKSDVSGRIWGLRAIGSAGGSLAGFGSWLSHRLRRFMGRIARRQPVAIDLRQALSILRIAHELERVGDLAKNIGKRIVALSAEDLARTSMLGVRHMAAVTLGRLRDGTGDADRFRIDLDRLAGIAGAFCVPSVSPA